MQGVVSLRLILRSVGFIIKNYNIQFVKELLLLCNLTLYPNKYEAVKYGGFLV